MVDLSSIREDPPDTPRDFSLAAEEMRFLGLHQERLNKVRVQIEKQRLYSRWVVLSFAIAVVIGLAILECSVLEYIFFATEQDVGSLVWLAISPIVSITLIVIFTLIGAFRGFREGDLNALPWKPAGKAVLDNTG